MSKAGTFDNKNVLCIVETPFQALVATCLFLMDENRHFNRCDLVVHDRFSGAQQLADNLRASGCFTKVIYAANGYPLQDHQGIEYFKDHILHKNACEQRFRDSYPELAGKTYDVLVCSVVNRFTIDARRYCVPSGISAFIDDGLGSHNGKTFDSLLFLDQGTSGVCCQHPTLSQQFKRVLRWPLRIVAGKGCTYEMRELWLLFVSDAERSLYSELPLKRIELPEDWSVLYQAIQGTPNLPDYTDGTTIYLALPKEGGVNLDDELNCLEEIRKSCGGRMYVRPHPRGDSTAYEDRGYTIIDPTLSWELLLASGCIRDDIVLAGFGSTAQMLPPLVFGMHARNLFLNKVVPGSAIPIDSVNDMVNNLIQGGCQAESLLVPDSYEDLREAMRRWT